MLHTNAGGFNLRNAADEGRGGGFIHGRKVLGGEGQTYCPTHSSTLSNKMDKSLLVVRDINPKNIVVGGDYYERGKFGKTRITKRRSECI